MGKWLLSNLSDVVRTHRDRPVLSPVCKLKRTIAVLVSHKLVMHILISEKKPMFFIYSTLGELGVYGPIFIFISRFCFLFFLVNDFWSSSCHLVSTKRLPVLFVWLRLLHVMRQVYLYSTMMPPNFFSKRRASTLESRLQQESLEQGPCIDAGANAQPA